MRWWREWVNPREKCARVGHVRQIVETEAYVRPEMGKDIFWSRYVAMRVTENTPACARCGMQLGERKEIDRQGISSLTMPSDMMRKLRTEGRVEL